MLLEPLGPNLRSRSHRSLTTLQVGALAGAGVMALTSAGDVLLLGVLLGVAAGDVEAGVASLLAGLVVLGRFGSTSLAALAGAQHVVGPAGTSGPVLLAAASWCAAAALTLSTRAEFAVAVVFGLAAADVVAGPATHSAESLAVRAAASLVAVALAWFAGGWVPARLARPAAVAAGVLGVVLVLAA
ncbi:MAG: hypothetical protein JO248_03740 [Acidimicrobiia bacterium]|nr:hypothetical protein [Acidimicrobiia bacterium]MBV8983536.1 hypothetical protein [Acidimicrobiia bacterium]MBV9284592.1 hypothetical protein [Acidimicrobiia bacterium]